VQATESLWHHRLGHASSNIVRQVLSRHNISFVKDTQTSHVCDACQQGKHHQLPYPKSFSVFTAPLDLVFSDVWGQLPIQSVVINIMLVSLMRIPNSHGSIL
jgi:hypothetical protein